MNITNYSLSYAKDLVTHLNDISLFIQSGSYGESENENELVENLNKLMSVKIEELSSCLTFLLLSKD